ncbi:MAG: flagellar biosynthesis anti-sigma factor FlgM [Erythrobacter sp.]
MPSFELSKLQGISATRALSESDRSLIDTRSRPVGGPKDTGGVRPGATTGVAIEVGASGDVSTPPVDAERVDQIRKAIKDGSYPLVPTKIADAIIAARVGFTVAD